MFAWDQVAKYGLWLLIGAMALFAIYRGVRFLVKTGETKVQKEVQDKVIQDSRTRTRIENETRNRTPEEIARDIGADGTGELR